MSKPQMWIVAVAVGVVAIIAGVKLFGGSAGEDDTARPQRLAQRDAKTERGGWSVRSNSEDLPTSDDVKVQRRVEARPGGIVPPRRGQTTEPQGGQPAAGSGRETQPVQGTAEGNETDTHVSGAAAGTGAAANPVQVKAGVSQPNPAATDVDGDTGDPGVASANGAPNAAADMQAAGNEQKPAQDQQAQQPTPPQVPTPAEVAIGAMYDSKDATFSIDTPTEVKDVGAIPGHGVTMMMTLAPDWTPDNQDDSSFLKLGDNLELSKNVNFLRLQYTDANGVQHGIGTDMTKWQDIQPPYSIAATVNENQLALIVNGQLVAHGTTDGLPYEPTANPTLQIGCFDFPMSRPCAAGDASGVVVVPPASNAALIERTKPSANP